MRPDSVLLCVVALLAIAPAGYFLWRHADSDSNSQHTHANTAGLAAASIATHHTDAKPAVLTASAQQQMQQDRRPSCSASEAFSTGFGRDGNDPTATNMMGRRGVTRESAEAFVRGGANTTVAPCPFGDVLQVGPTGAVRFLCGLHMLPPDAPLFSFGSNGDFRFEDAVRGAAPSIPVVVFDPTMSQEAMSRRQRGSLQKALDHAAARNYTFVGTGIGPRKGFLEMQTIKKKRLFCARVDTLPSLLGATQHASIGVLKIDASGELEIFAQLEASGFDLAAKVMQWVVAAREPVPCVQLLHANIVSNTHLSPQAGILLTHSPFAACLQLGCHCTTLDVALSLHVLILDGGVFDLA